MLPLCGAMRSASCRQGHGVVSVEPGQARPLRLFFQQGFQAGEWCVCRERALGGLNRSPGCCLDLFLMFVVMTIEAKQLPVAAIRWIVVMVVVAMMYGKFPQVGGGELACAATADPWIDLECPLAIILFALRCGTPCRCNNVVKSLGAGYLCVRHVGRQQFQKSNGMPLPG